LRKPHHKFFIIRRFVVPMVTSLACCFLATQANAEKSKLTHCVDPLKRIIIQITQGVSERNLGAACKGNTATLNLGSFEANRKAQFKVSELPVIEHESFYGLAFYYTGVQFFRVGDGLTEPVPPDQSVILDNNHWLAAVGRFEALLFKAPNAVVTVTKEELVLTWLKNITVSLNVSIVKKSDFASINPQWNSLRYTHLWSWLASLTKVIEWTLVKIHKHITSNWGWTIVIFAVLLKILLLPIGIMTVRLQRKVSQYQTVLAPQLTEIKAKHDGEQAHERIMVAHKTLGITPFYILRPMFGLLIQIPILVAVFNALGEMPQLAGASFLWIENLAYPDSIGTLPFVIPLFGDKVSLLPMIMTVATVFSTFIFQNRHAPSQEVNRQKRNLYLMAGGFFFLFYPFPAAMVLYWTLANILQAVQQELVKI